MSNPSIEPFDVRVHLEDTDLSGRAYHASYLCFLERGRTELLRRLGFANQDIAGTLGVIFVVRRMRIEYLAPAVMDDLLRIETEISELSGASMEFLQRVSCGRRELVTANVLVASVCGGRAARIPDDLRRRLQTLLEAPGPSD
jgi:acyl-CoA thioester hydrolase